MIGRHISPLAFRRTWRGARSPRKNAFIPPTPGETNPPPFRAQISPAGASSDRSKPTAPMPSTTARALNSSEITSSRQSMTATANMISAKPRPASPAIPDATYRLAETAPTPAAPMRNRLKTSTRATSTSASPDPAARNSLQRPCEDIERGRGDGLHLAAAHLGTKLFGDHRRVHSVPNDLRPDEDDELGSHLGGSRRAERRPDKGDLVEHRYALARLLLLVLDQPGEQHGLSADDRDLAADLALGNRWREVRAARVARVLHFADLLIDVEQDRAVRVHPRLHMQDDARVLVVDRVDHRVVGAENGRAAGRDRDLIAHLKRRFAVVDHDQRRIGQDLDVG